MAFELIDKSGKRKVCGRCKSARKPVDRMGLCCDCREVRRQERRAAKQDFRQLMAEIRGGAA